VNIVNRPASADLRPSLDRSSPVPLYHQLARDLKAAVADGRIATGSFLQNELELADRWQVSRPTVRRAIQELVDSGLLVRQRGVGTQVVNRESRPDVRSVICIFPYPPRTPDLPTL
jgi:DNA-binding GntR family transcriptional regulator